MKKNQTLCIRLSGEEAEELERMAAQFSLDKSGLVRMALSEFRDRLSIENAITDSMENLEIRLARIEKKQEQFALVIGRSALATESERTATSRQAFADKIARIVETIGD